MATTTTAKRSGKKRYISEVVCHNCKVKGHYANKCPAKKPLPEDDTTKWCSLHKPWSHSDNECMAQQATPQSPPPVSALPATISPATETCPTPFVASSSFSSIKKMGLQLLVDSGCSPHMVDPAIIPNEKTAPSRIPGASTTENCLRSRIARVVSHRHGEAQDRCREHCRHTTRGERVCYAGTWPWSESAVFVSRGSKRGRR